MTSQSRQEIAEAKRLTVLNSPRARAIAADDPKLAEVLRRPEIVCEVNEAGQAVLDRAARAPRPEAPDPTEPPPEGPEQPGPEAAPAPEPPTFAEFVELDERAGLPVFPVEALPQALGDWAEEAAEAEQVPLDIAAAMTLGAAAIALAGKAKVDMYGGEPLNFFLALTDRSGANKSGIFARALRPLEDWNAERIKTLNDRIDEWRSELSAIESKIKQIKAELEKPRKAVDRYDEGDAKDRLEHAIKAQRELLENKPRGDVRVCGDITPEKLCDLLAGNRTVAQLSPEGAEVFEGMARYQADGKGAGKMEPYLKSWKGDALMVDRKNGTQIAISDPTLTIVLAAQPSVLEKLRDPDGSREGRGLLGRFLYVVPVSRVGTRRLVRRKVPVTAESAYRDALRRLLDLPYPAEGEPPMIQASNAAWCIASAFYDETERELRAGGSLVDVESFASKLRSYHARLAGVLHLADGRGVADEIDAETMTRALTLTRYFLAHGCAAHGMMSTVLEVAVALKLWATISKLAERAAEEDGSISARDLAQIAKGQRAFKKVAAIDDALRVLVGAGYVRRFNRHPGGARLAINPAASAGARGEGGEVSC